MGTGGRGRRGERRTGRFVGSEDCVGVAEVRYCFEVFHGEGIEARDGRWGVGSGFDDRGDCLDDTDSLDFWSASIKVSAEG